MKDKSNPYKSSLEKAFLLGNEFLEGLDNVPVGAIASYDELKALWDWNLPLKGKASVEVVEELNTAALPGLHLSQSGRFFAWVIGGTHPAALAADWLTSIWDQNAGMFSVAPSASIGEEIAGQWLKQLLKLPFNASFAFVTGCQMAHFTCLNAARNHLFYEAGWDIETQGFFGAPRIRLICSDQKHATINRAIRMLGFGTDNLIQIPTDELGRINGALLENELMKEPIAPTLLFLQAGDVNTGIYDDFKSIIPMARKVNAWVHIDGAFGLWASASKRYTHLTEGVEAADSWATDGHKWLNVPYDCGYAFTAHPKAHHRSLSQLASYLTHGDKGRDQMNWTPEFSRRARGFATYAVIKELGASGIEELIDRTCRHAYSIVDQASQLPNTEIIAKPTINQGLLRFRHPFSTSEKDHDDFTEKVIQAVNESGEAFFQPTTFKGKRCMRVSVSGWRTNDMDVSRTILAMAKAIDTSTSLSTRN